MKIRYFTQISCIALMIAATVAGVVSCEKNLPNDENISTDSIGQNNPEENPKTIEFTVDGISFTMHLVKGGNYLMGAQNADVQQSNYDPDARLWEGPVCEVAVEDFYIGETEVTQALWKAVMDYNYSNHRGNELPVENVSWNDVQEFVTKLSALTGRNFRLPTEIEWEYAARGGQQSKGYLYSGSDEVNEVAWHWGNSDERTHRVGSKKANELGLYDMSGNVYEWCQDSWRRSHDDSPIGSYRTYKGGCFDSLSVYCRVTYRSCGVENQRFNNYLGFRLAMK